MTKYAARQIAFEVNNPNSHAMKLIISKWICDALELKAEDRVNIIIVKLPKGKSIEIDSFLKTDGEIQYLSVNAGERISVTVSPSLPYN